MKTNPIVIERTFNAPVSRVWEAITDKDQMAQWYFEVKEFKPEVGFEFKIYGMERDGKEYPTTCKVLEVQVEKKLSYTWVFDNAPAETIVTFELFDEGNKTKLKLTHEGLEKLPAEDKNLSKENFIEGWMQILGSSLKEYLETV